MRGQKVKIDAHLLQVRGAGNSFPDSTTVGATQRTGISTNAPPSVFAFSNDWWANPSGSSNFGCHTRYVIRVIERCFLT